MAKGDDKKNVNASIGKQAVDTQSLYNQFLGAPSNAPVTPGGRAPGTGLFGDLENAKGRSSVLYDDTKNNFDAFTQTGGLDPEGISRLRAIYGDGSAGSGGGGGGGGISYSLPSTSAFEGVNFNRNSAAGGVNIPDFGESNSTYRNFAQTGGVDAQKLQEALGLYRPLTSEKGGFTDDRLAGIKSDTNTLRNTNYDDVKNRAVLNDFEQTGGYTPEQIAQIKRQAASSGSSIYSSLADNLARNKSVTGLGTGYNPALFSLARKSAQDANAATLNASTSLNNQIRANKLDASKTQAQLALQADAEKRAALAAASGTDISTQGLIDATRLSAISGIGGENFRNEQLISGNKLAGAQGLESTAGKQAQLALSKAGLLDQYGLGLGQLDLSRAGGLDSYALNSAQLQAAASGAGAGRASADQAARAQIEEFLLSQGQSGKQFGAGGLLSLYNSKPEEVMAYQDLIGRTIGANAGANQGYLGLNIANNQSGGNKALDWLKTIGSFAGPLIGTAFSSGNSGIARPNSVPWGPTGYPGLVTG